MTNITLIKKRVIIIKFCCSLIGIEFKILLHLLYQILICWLYIWEMAASSSHFFDVSSVTLSKFKSISITCVKNNLLKKKQNLHQDWKKFDEESKAMRQSAKRFLIILRYLTQIFSLFHSSKSFWKVAWILWYFHSLAPEQTC